MNDIETQRTGARWLKWSGVYSGELSWGGSLLLKCAFLGIGVCFVYWAGWPQPSLPSVSRSSTPQPGFLSADTMYSSSAGPAPEAVRIVPLPVNKAGQSIHLVAEENIGQPGGVKPFIVDLNDGTSDELEHLPGIGAVLAGRIVAHRTSHGAFRRVEDLVLVPGIGEKRLRQLRPYVGVRESTSGMGR